jgi:hypothetical protein
MSASDYFAMCRALLDNVRFSEASAVGSPDGSPFDAGQLAAVVKNHQGQLPACYRASYVAPLLAALPDVVVQLRQQFRSTTASRAIRSSARRCPGRPWRWSGAAPRWLAPRPRRAFRSRSDDRAAERASRRRLRDAQVSRW